MALDEVPSDAMVGPVDPGLVALSMVVDVVHRDDTPRPESMMKRIVVGVDAARGWSAVVHQSMAYARTADASVEFVICVGNDVSSDDRRLLGDELTAAVAPNASDVTFSVRVVVGEPRDVLRDAGEGADLLVVGARGTSSGRKLLLGSVAQVLLQGRGCPVLVVRDLEVKPTDNRQPGCGRR